MHVVAHARLVLARRPWLYWLIVAAIAAPTAAAVHTQLSAVAEARASWGATRSVLVADRTLGPADEIAVSPVDLPVAMVPLGALTELPDGAELRQHVGAGEVLVDLDLATAAGPAARAAHGTLVVGLSDPRSRTLSIGLTVQVVADGVVLAEQATVVDLVDEVVFVSVAPADAASVAAAAHADLATLVYVP